MVVLALVVAHDLHEVLKLGTAVFGSKLPVARILNSSLSLMYGTSTEFQRNTQQMSSSLVGRSRLYNREPLNAISRRFSGRMKENGD